MNDTPKYPPTIFANWPRPALERGWSWPISATTLDAAIPGLWATKLEQAIVYHLRRGRITLEAAEWMRRYPYSAEAGVFLSQHYRAQRETAWRRRANPPRWCVRRGVQYWYATDRTAPPPWPHLHSPTFHGILERIARVERAEALERERERRAPWL